MNEGEASQRKYWFCFKVRGGNWIEKGPYRTQEEAAAARSAAKAADAEVGNVFLATPEEAHERCASGRTG